MNLKYYDKKYTNVIVIIRHSKSKHYYKKKILCEVT
jgi:hypothetical protein